MSIAEQIYAIVKTLTPDQASKILAFAEFIQSKHSTPVEEDQEISWADLVNSSAGAWAEDFPTLEEIRAEEGQATKAISLSDEEVARRAEALYENILRHQVETEENIGKMVIIDIGAGEYEIDGTGLEASRILRKKYPLAQLFGIRIGYNVAASFGGVMERIKR